MADQLIRAILILILPENGMNNAKLERSDRLQRVYALLRSSERPISTMEIIQGANVCAVNSTISELRRNNIGIKCECLNKVFYYSLDRGTSK